jgi:hypothetical protein
VERYNAAESMNQVKLDTHLIKGNIAVNFFLGGRGSKNQNVNVHVYTGKKRVQHLIEGGKEKVRKRMRL